MMCVHLFEAARALAPLEDRPVLIFDAMNLFLRVYSANPSISQHGHHVGGVVGFLKSMRNIIDRFSPRKIFVVWEGGGSSRRRAIYPDYKKGKKPARMNRFYEQDIPDTQMNRNKQIGALIKMMKNMPICQVYVGDCEGDDVIGYLCKYKLRDLPKVIVSSDQDYYHLLDDKTNIFRLGRKEIVTRDDIPALLGVSSNNYCIAKAAVGDSSDNISGIKGAGYKTMAKRFSFLTDDEEADIEKIFEYASAHAEGKIKIYREIANNFELLERNWRLIYLDSRNLAASQVNQIEYIVDTFEPKRNKIGMMRDLIAEGIQNFDVESLFLSFTYLD
jgi:5'-3' exonuclease